MTYFTFIIFQSRGTNQVEYTRTGSRAGEDQRSRSSVPESAVSAEHDPAGVRHDPSTSHGSPRRKVSFYASPFSDGYRIFEMKGTSKVVCTFGKLTSCFSGKSKISLRGRATTCGQFFPKTA